MSNPPEAFLAACRTVGLCLADDETARLGRYLDLLLETNRRFNLTAVTEPETAWLRHIFDSLTLLPHVGSSGSIVDVGSGGGLPGVPLAIALPGARVTMLEATGKKARFIERVIGELQLSNASVISERAETVGQDAAHRQAYDLAVARAVGPMRVMLELTLPLVRVGGRVLAMKGRRVTEELDEAGDALMQLGGGGVELYEAMPGLEQDAVIVEVVKDGPTPKRYPRRPGEPKARPL